MVSRFNSTTASSWDLFSAGQEMHCGLLDSGTERRKYYGPGLEHNFKITPG